MADLVGPRLYSCCNCRNHVSLHDDIISKAFQLTAALPKENRKLREMKKRRSTHIASWLDETDLPLDWKEKIMTCALHKLNADEDIDIINIHYILPWKDLIDVKRHLCKNILNKPLVDELKELWENGVLTYDKFTERCSSCKQQ